MDQVRRATGYSRTRIYELMRENKFPRAVRLGAAAVGWFEDEIRAWQDTLPRVSLEGEVADDPMGLALERRGVRAEIEQALAA